MHPTLAIPAAPLTVARLALALTGFTVTGQPGPFGTVVGEHPCCVPAGPYTVTDASGAVIGEYGIHWQAERLAVRTWRQRAEAADYCLTREAVAEQLRLKIELRAAEAHAAALNARIKAIDAAHGDDILSLDIALADYATAVEAHRRAQHEFADYDVAEAA